MERRYPRNRGFVAKPGMSADPDMPSGDYRSDPVQVIDTIFGFWIEKAVAACVICTAVRVAGAQCVGHRLHTVASLATWEKLVKPQKTEAYGSSP